MSFAESVILPLAIFKKLKFDGVEDGYSKRDSILNNPRLSSSEKLQMLEQEKHLKVKPFQEPTKHMDADVDNSNMILRHIEQKYHPHVKSVLEYISRNKQVVSWDSDTLELQLHGKPVVGSNIIDIFQSLTKNSVITRDSDVPFGTYQLYKILVFELGVPKDWIPARLYMRSSQRVKPSIQRKKRKTNDELEGTSQLGHGNWICY